MLPVKAMHLPWPWYESALCSRSTAGGHNHVSEDRHRGLGSESRLKCVCNKSSEVRADTDPSACLSHRPTPTCSSTPTSGFHSGHPQNSRPLPQNSRWTSAGCDGRHIETPQVQIDKLVRNCPNHNQFIT